MGKTAQAGIIAATLAALLFLLASCGAPEESATSSGSQSQASTETPASPTPASPKPSDATDLSLPSAPPEVAAAEPAAGDAEPQPQNAPPMADAPAAEAPIVPQDGEPAASSTAADAKPETVERTSDSAESGGMFAQPEPLDGDGSIPPRDRDAECIALGIEAANCTDYDKILASLRQAWTAYTCPKEMIKNHAYAVSLVLDPTKRASMTEEEAKKAIAPELHADPAEVVARLTKMASHMSASLSGAAFKIEPAGAQKITATTEQPVHWEWTVTPLRSGKNMRLTLTLSAHVGKEEGNLSEVQIKTLVENIEVNVSPWEEILAAIPTAQQGLAVGATIFGILSAIWAYLNRSRIGRWLGTKTSEPEKKGRGRRGKRP